MPDLVVVEDLRKRYRAASCPARPLAGSVAVFGFLGVRLFERRAVD